MNPKVLSVANSCHYNENFKKWQTSFTDKCPPPWELPQQIPAPGKSLDAKAPGCRQIFGVNPQGCVGEGRVVMDEIDTCITRMQNMLISLSVTLFVIL